jgi:hypothetical protein
MSIDKVCFIKRAGYNADNVAQLELRSLDSKAAPTPPMDAFNWHWFISNADNARAILAVALAGMTAGRAVECTVDGPTTGSSFGSITGIYLVGDIANDLT